VLKTTKKAKRRQQNFHKLDDNEGGVIKRHKVFMRDLSMKDQSLAFSKDSSVESQDDQEDDFMRIEKNIHKSPYTIYPDSSLKQVWDFGTFIFILYVSLVVPYRLSFLRDGN